MNNWGKPALQWSSYQTAREFHSRAYGRRRTYVIAGKAIGRKGRWSWEAYLEVFCDHCCGDHEHKVVLMSGAELSIENMMYYVGQAKQLFTHVDNLGNGTL
jgi:hypothetical protein